MTGRSRSLNLTERTVTNVKIHIDYGGLKIVTRRYNGTDVWDICMVWFGLVWFGGTCRFLCKTVYSPRCSLNEYCRSSAVNMLLPQPVSCLCNVNRATCPPILFCTAHSPYPRLTAVQASRISEPTANAKRLFGSKNFRNTSNKSIRAHNFSFSKIQSFSAAENESLTSYKMQPVDLTLSMMDLD
jgi:hypothetical protein